MPGTAAMQKYIEEFFDWSDGYDAFYRICMAVVGLISLVIFFIIVAALSSLIPFS